ncbi:acyltransferase family protein [Kordiimonas lipolytica]|uniref:Acyltransferase family protein n=1 Tax=Kordiimonas lipolytica TaxID=1662421 RepID=A0ABV8UG14_9PROT|nr:acyltransferase [Kordiimonas lipolytica]
MGKVERGAASQGFFQNVHWFRGLAILFIVATHANDLLVWPESSSLAQLSQAIIRESSLWFIFIAGFLFLHLAPRHTPSSYFKSKLKNVIMPYLICSVPALALTLTLYPENLPAALTDLTPLKQALVMLLTGSHMAHFWFIPAIALVYLIGPGLLALERRGTLYWLLIPLCLWSLVMSRDGLQLVTGLGLVAAPASKALYMLPAYIAGMAMRRHYDLLDPLIRKHWLPLTAMTSIPFAFLLTGALPGLHWAFAWKLMSAALVLTALGTLPKGLPLRPIETLGTYSFGIYFVHGYALKALSFVLQGQTALADILTADWLGYVLLTTVTALACTLGLVSCRKLLGHRSRYLVGV